MSKRRAFGELSLSDVNAANKSKPSQQQPVKKKAKTSLVSTATGIKVHSDQDDSSKNSKSQGSSVSRNSSMDSKTSTELSVTTTAATKMAKLLRKTTSKFSMLDIPFGFPPEKTDEEKFMEAETPVINNTRRAKLKAKKQPNPPPDQPPPKHPQQVVRNKHAAARAAAEEEEYRQELKQQYLKKREPATPPTPPGSIVPKRKYESRALNRLHNKAKAERKEQAKQVLNERRRKARKDFWLQGIMHTKRMEEEKAEKERLAASAAARTKKKAASNQTVAEIVAEFREQCKGKDTAEILESIFSSPEYETSSEDESDSSRPLPVVAIKKRKKKSSPRKKSKSIHKEPASDTNEAAKGESISILDRNSTSPSISDRERTGDSEKVDSTAIDDASHDQNERHTSPAIEMAKSPVAASGISSPSQPCPHVHTPASSNQVGPTEPSCHSPESFDTTPFVPQRPVKLQAEELMSPEDDEPFMIESSAPPRTPKDESPLPRDIETSPRQTEVRFQSDIALQSKDESKPKTASVDSPDTEMSTDYHPSQRSEEEAAQSLLALLAPTANTEQIESPTRAKEQDYSESFRTPSSTDSSSNEASSNAPDSVPKSESKADGDSHHKTSGACYAAQSPEGYDLNSDTIKARFPMTTTFDQENPPHEVTLDNEKVAEADRIHNVVLSHTSNSDTDEPPQTARVAYDGVCDITVDSSFTLKPVPPEEPLRYLETPVNDSEIVNLMLQKETMPWGVRKSTIDMLIGLDLEFRKVQTWDDSDVSDDSFDEEEPAEEEPQLPTRAPKPEDFETPCVPITSFQVSGKASSSINSDAVSRSANPDETGELADPGTATPGPAPSEKCSSPSPMNLDSSQQSMEDTADSNPIDGGERPSEVEQAQQHEDQHTDTGRRQGMETDESDDPSAPMEPSPENFRAGLAQWTAQSAGMRGILPIFQLANGQWFQHPRLPPGWTLGVSKTQNRPYYSHPDLGRTFYPPLPLPDNSSNDDDSNSMLIPFRSTGRSNGSAMTSFVIATPLGSESSQGTTSRRSGAHIPATTNSGRADTPATANSEEIITPAAADRRDTDAPGTATTASTSGSSDNFSSPESASKCGSRQSPQDDLSTSSLSLSSCSDCSLTSNKSESAEANLDRNIPTAVHMTVSADRSGTIEDNNHKAPAEYMGNQSNNSKHPLQDSVTKTTPAAQSDEISSTGTRELWDSKEISASLQIRTEFLEVGPQSQANELEPQNSERASDEAGQDDSTRPDQASDKPISGDIMQKDSPDIASASSSILRQLEHSRRKEDHLFKKAPHTLSSLAHGGDSNEKYLSPSLRSEDDGISAHHDEAEFDFPMNDDEDMNDTISRDYGSDGDDEVSTSPNHQADDDDELVSPNQGDAVAPKQHECGRFSPNQDEVQIQQEIMSPAVEGGSDSDDPDDEHDLSLLPGVLKGEPILLSSSEKPSPEIEFQVRESSSKGRSYYDQHMGVLGQLDKSSSHMSPINCDHDSVSDGVSTLGEDGASMTKGSYGDDTDDDGEQSFTSHHSFNNNQSHQGSSALSRMSHRIRFPPMPLDCLQRLEEIFANRDKSKSKKKKKKKSKKPAIPKTITAYC